jgi:MipA family protein
MHALPALPPLRRLPAALLLAAAFAAHAQEGPAEPLWELGAVAIGVSQQAYPGADQNVQRALALPYVLYRGRVLRADRETAGLRAFKTETFELDIGVAGAFGSSSKDIEARRGMADLGTLVEFGPRLKWNLGEAAGGRVRLELPLRGVFDLNDGLAHRGMAFEPELQWRTRTDGGWFWSLGVGAIFADRRLADTFYRVSAAEATPDRPTWDARAGRVAWRGSASVARSLGPDWRVFGFLRVDSVAGAANEASPLVRRTTGATAGIGLSWTWMRSERRAADE